MSQIWVFWQKKWIHEKFRNREKNIKFAVVYIVGLFFSKNFFSKSCKKEISRRKSGVLFLSNQETEHWALSLQSQNTEQFLSKQKCQLNVSKAKHFTFLNVVNWNTALSAVRQLASIAKFTWSVFGHPHTSGPHLRKTVRLINLFRLSNHKTFCVRGQ